MFGDDTYSRLNRELNQIQRATRAVDVCRPDRTMSVVQAHVASLTQPMAAYQAVLDPAGEVQRTLDEMMEVTRPLDSGIASLGRPDERLGTMVGSALEDARKIEGAMEAARPMDMGSGSVDQAALMGSTLSSLMGTSSVQDMMQRLDDVTTSNDAVHQFLRDGHSPGLDALRQDAFAVSRLVSEHVVPLAETLQPTLDAIDRARVNVADLLGSDYAQQLARQVTEFTGVTTAAEAYDLLSGRLHDLRSDLDGISFEVDDEGNFVVDGESVDDAEERNHERSAVNGQPTSAPPRKSKEQALRQALVYIGFLLTLRQSVVSEKLAQPIGDLLRAPSPAISAPKDDTAAQLENGRRLIVDFETVMVAERSLDGDVLHLLEAGSHVTIHSEDSGWYRVTWQGDIAITGWVLAADLEPTDAEKAAAARSACGLPSTGAARSE